MIHLEKSSVKSREFCSVKWNHWVGIPFAVIATAEQPFTHLPHRDPIASDITLKDMGTINRQKHNKVQ